MKVNNFQYAKNCKFFSMKKIIVFLVCIVFLVNFVFAMMPYPVQQGQTEQYYTIVYDAEGEAEIAARILIHNYGDEAIKNLKAEIPGRSIRMIGAVQEYYDTIKRCSYYEDVCAGDEYNCDEGICIYKEEGCSKVCSQEYEEQTWPPKYHNLKYEQEILSDSIVFNFNFEKEIKSQKDATLILYYKSEDYTTKKENIFNFDFETLKINYDTSYISIGVDVDNNLYLENVDSQVEYRDNSYFTGFSEAMTSAKMTPDYVGNIGYGSYHKDANSLDPLESFHVTGRYAKSWYDLNKKLVLGGIFGGLILLGLIIIGLVFVVKKLNKNNLRGKLILSGFFSALVTISIWVIISIFKNNLNDWIGWQYSSLVFGLFIVAAVLLTLVCIVGPVIYFWSKYNAITGVWALVSFVIWLFIFGVIIAIIFGILNKPEQIYPMYERGVYTDQVFSGVVEPAIMTD
ncbi:MAG TPA: hypothetical protein VJB89_04215 [Candidatus Nanoarchaeia archaeon]|nr:hypothetical protein [Candidatus Nanoarchaeia archaeon]